LGVDECSLKAQITLARMTQAVARMADSSCLIKKRYNIGNAIDLYYKFVKNHLL